MVIQGGRKNMTWMEPEMNITQLSGDRVIHFGVSGPHRSALVPFEEVKTGS
jgi:hypothetical protein